MAILQITDSDGNVAELDYRIDARGTGNAKWTCRNPESAFSNRITVDSWQEATVKWERNYRDEYVGTACCYLDQWGNDCPLPCLELENIFNEGIHEPGSNGTGTITMSREGIMTVGDASWSFLRHSGGDAI